MSMRFAMVAAADEGRGLGKNGQLPWKLPGDTAFFKRITSTTRDANKRNAVIMGRKTWETIPARFQPLENRLNVVVTRNPSYAVPEGVVTASSMAEALKAIAADDSVEDVFVVGGGEIYALGIAMPECWRIYLTRVEGRFDCDAFFPTIGEEFELLESSERHEEGGIGYVFETWDRR